MSLPAPERGAIVVVTGASSGIGVALAEALAARGYDLLLTARRAQRIDELARELRARHGVVAETVAGDLADRGFRDRLAGRLAGERVIGLCNNAGTAVFGRFQDLPRDRDRDLVDVNAVAVHELMAAVLPGMLERGAGAILNVGSVGGFQPMPGNSTYSASKAFVNWLSEAVHVDLRGTPVSCSLLCPGLVRTELHARAGVPHVSGSGPSFAWTSTERVANAGVDAMLCGRRRVTPGLYAKLSAASGQLAPRGIVLRTIRRAAEQVARGRASDVGALTAATDTLLPPEP